MKELLLIQITPEELKEIIHTSVKEVLSEIREEIKPKEPDELITRKEAAKLLQISLTTLYHWSRDSKLKYYKIGSKVFYKRNEIMANFNSMKEV